MKRSLWLLWPLALGAGGCRREPTIVDINPPRPKASVAVSAEVPVDALLPGELPQGTMKAYGLVLPRAFTIQRRFDDSIAAQGLATRQEVVTYLRRRIEASSIEETKSSVIFKSARVKNVPNGPFLRVNVSDAGGIIEISLQDLTPAPVDTSLTEEERWRKAGLKPNGEVLDPTRAM